MFELFGVVVVSSIALLVLVLPMITSARVLRLSRELDDLRERIDAIEAHLRGAPAAPPRATTPQPSTPVAHQEPTVGYTDTAPPNVATATPPLYSDLAPASAVPAAVEDLEGKIGGRWLLYTGVLVLLLGVSFFLKYAFDNEWINETGRVLAGVLAGVGLIAGGARLSMHGLATFGQALIGTGLAILYLSIYAALAFYTIIGTTTAFAMMFIVTIAAAALAEWQRAQALAFIAVGGGFLTPFLVGGSDDAQLFLFTYDALLVGGTMLLARRHNWAALNALSYLFTVLTVLAWASVHYRDRLWLRTVLFLTLYCVLFLQILRETRRSQSPSRATSAVVLLLATAPFLYHVSAVMITAQHPPAIHIYMIAFTAVGLWLTAEPHRPALRLLVLAGSYVPLLGSLTLPDGLSWTMANTVTIIAVASLHLLAPLDRVLRQQDTLQRSELIALHIVLIGAYALLHEALAATYPELRGVIGVALAIGALSLWRRLRERDDVAAINMFALACSLLAIATAVQFDGRAVAVGWAAEGAAATWIGLRAANNWVQRVGQVLWVISVLQLLDNFFETPAGFTAILNARAATTAFVVGIGYGLAWMFARHGESTRDATHTRAALHVAASIVTMIWITAEVASYWEVRYTSPQAYLYEQLNLSLAWAAYGALLIIVGMRRSYAPDRYIGITVLGITILKVFFSDLWELGGIYRVVGFIVFGVLLVAVSYLYQQRKAAPTSSPSPAATPPSDQPV